MRRGFKGAEWRMNGSAHISTTMGYCVFNLDKESTDSRCEFDLFIYSLLCWRIGAASCD